MSSIFDAGDLQRLNRERMLTEQAPRQLPVEDRSPEDPLDVLTVRDEENPFEIMLEGLMMALQEIANE